MKLIKHSKSYVPRVGDRFTYDAHEYRSKVFTITGIFNSNNSYLRFIVTPNSYGGWHCDGDSKYLWYPRKKPIFIVK